VDGHEQQASSIEKALKIYLQSQHGSIGFHKNKK
jgi:hypothetical protein